MSGGSIESIEINSRIFPVAADADASRDLGGFSKEIMMNGDGTSRYKKTRKPWKIGGVSVAIDDTQGDQEFLQAVADQEAEVPVVIRFVTGISYGGYGSVVDDLEFSSENATADISLAGGFALEIL